DQIVTLLNQKADLELKEDGEVEDGDTVVIDFEGFKDGVPFEGGKADNYDLVIGSNSFIPGFESQLIGMKSEETKEIDVKFPDDYQAEEMKGQPATFKVTVHEIKKKVLPELNDEFVEELKYEGVKTVEDLKNYTKDNLLKRKQDDAKRKAEDDLVDSLVDMTEVEIPDVLIKSETDNIVSNYEQNMMQQGFSLADFLKMTGQKMEDFRDSLKENAIKRIKTNLALQEIARNEKVEISEEEVDEEYKRLSEMYGMDVEQIKMYIPVSSIQSDLKTQKTLDLLKK
ncbi:MAG: trigger factor, partial [Erysipelotrichaceae bacterium]|nr:trigger factor [Erysipelotrichaceae bacterium]